MTVDPRFYASLGALTLEAAAGLTGAEMTGDPKLVITGIASADSARSGEIAFIEGDGASQGALSPDLKVVVLSKAAVSRVSEGVACLVAKSPRHAHNVIARTMFAPRHMLAQGTVAISSEARIHPGAVIGPGTVVGAGAAIGEGTVIGANAVIGPGVQIGRNSFVGACASLHCALVGDHVTVFPGARIGEAGFGVTPTSHGLEDAPHYGRVIVQDHVSIGANTCIDRGVADTIIGERTKIDNLCQIAHNVVLGRSVIVAAFAGISGSVRVGDGSMMGGRVGIADHIKVSDGVSLAAGSGLLRDIGPGETWGGTPAKPIRQWLREVAWLSKQANPKKRD